MDREAFKLRMQALKSYREQNPGKSYLDWKASLPDNLQDESNYNLLRAYELGYEPETVEGDSLKHLPTRDLETGEILKKPWHPTFLIGLQEDAKLGYYPLTVDGTTYTTTWEGNENTIYKYADGGEIPPEPIPYKGKLYKDRYGKKYTEQQVAEYYLDGTDEIDRFTGNPLNKGLNPLLDIRDAADFTPLGDAASVYEAYDSARQGDWLGAGLAALTVIPFVPLTVKLFRRNYKGITPKIKTKGGYGYNFNTSVNKNITNNQLDNIANISAEDLAKRTKAVNQSYNAAERLMDDPEYITRANLVKRQFGDDYTTAYADIIDAYNTDPTKLPKLTEINEKISSATGTMYKDFENNGDFYYGINPKQTKLGNYLTEHEWSHYTDMLKAGDLPSADAGNNMFYLMSKDIVNGVDKRDWYFTQPTELKAHMNQLREYMFNNGYINRRGQAVSPKMMKKVIEEVSNIDSMREIARASRQFNNINKYTKWFNSIPLLGVGALGVYSNENRND